MSLAKPLGGHLFACLMCDSSFKWSGHGRHPYFCSDECKRRRINQTRARRPSTRVCEVDGCERPLQGRGLCKPHWKQKRREEGYKAPSDAWTERRREQYKKRRSSGVRNGDKAALAAVVARDGLVCGWCSEPVDLSRRYPDPSSASLDHVVPVARGGSNELGNMQLLHYSCNSAKGVL